MNKFLAMGLAALFLMIAVLIGKYPNSILYHVITYLLIYAALFINRQG